MAINAKQLCEDLPKDCVNYENGVLVITRNGKVIFSEAIDEPDVAEDRLCELAEQGLIVF
ncbi:MAG: hypothetical protein H0Z24_03310 [Thermosipho sp. (in: Bacteria)]|nr:hypothetical protein [Thermosipho sp. (in: thermotogales)]